MKVFYTQAVRHPDFNQVYLLAVDFLANGDESTHLQGVWATNSLEGKGLIFAVDEVAAKYTDWGVAQGGKFNISPSDPAVLAAKACLNK